MKKLLLAAAVSALLAAGPAVAQVYVGAGVGTARTDSNETSMKIYGGFQFNPTWGLELGITDFDRYRGSDAEAWSIAGTGKMPLADRWFLLGKLGATSNRPKFSGGSNHSDLLLGIGLGYTMTKNVGLRLEYEDFGRLSNSSIGSNSKGNNLSLSVNYTF